MRLRPGNYFGFGRFWAIMSGAGIGSGEPVHAMDDRTDEYHTIVVILGIVVMLTAFLSAQFYYGIHNEASAAGILGLFLAAVTAVVGFVFGVKTGTNSGLRAADRVVSDNKHATRVNAEKGLNFVKDVGESVETALKELATAQPDRKMRSMLREADRRPADLEVEDFQKEFSIRMAELRGRFELLRDLSS